MYIFIDPSYKSTGILVAETGKIKHFTIDTRKDDENYGYRKIYNNIIDLSKNCKFAIIEDYAYNYGKGDSRSITRLAEVKGLIKLALLQNNVKIIHMPIQVWKAFFRDLPKKKDKKYIKTVENRFNVKLRNTDETDAFLIYFSFCKLMAGEARTPGQEKFIKDFQVLKNG